MGTLSVVSGSTRHQRAIDIKHLIWTPTTRSHVYTIHLDGVHRQFLDWLTQSHTTK